MKTRTVYKFKDIDKRELSFEDWIVYIIRENKHRLPWFRNKTIK